MLDTPLAAIKPSKAAHYGPKHNDIAFGAIKSIYCLDMKNIFLFMMALELLHYYIML